jgi:hypothetical protein
VALRGRVVEWLAEDRDGGHALVGRQVLVAEHDNLVDP